MYFWKIFIVAYFPVYAHFAAGALYTAAQPKCQLLWADESGKYRVILPLFPFPTSLWLTAQFLIHPFTSRVWLFPIRHTVQDLYFHGNIFFCILFFYIILKRYYGEREWSCSLKHEKTVLRKHLSYAYHSFIIRTFSNIR